MVFVKVNKKEFITVTSIIGGALLLCFLILMITLPAYAYKCKLADFREFKKMPKEPSKIEYTFKGETGGNVTLSITDDATIKALTDALFDRVYTRETKQERTATETLKIFGEGGKFWTLDVSFVKSKNGFYYLADNGQVAEILQQIKDSQ